MRCALLLLAGCWTGSASTTAPATNQTDEPTVPSAFEITMERTACFGTCPIYKVSIDGDGRVRWHGEQYVVAIGERRATVPPKRIAEIRRMLDTVQFWKRDARGDLADPQPECVRTGNSTSCSLSKNITICSDTSSAIITVRANRTEKHTVTNDHCDESPLEELEAMIDDIARTSAWIGERVLTH
ncbi:MAG: DUF6438 domain-containing protein [Myxococcota bacterium]|nr:DUF6438 domain-containing protein [Myxococcota bacterium]